MPIDVVHARRHGKRGGPPTRSPRARARGFYTGVSTPSERPAGGFFRAGAGLARGHKSPQRKLGDCDDVHRLAGLCRSTSCTPGGMANGVARRPAVPGLAPGAFIRIEGGVARAISPALQASAGRMPKRSLHGVSEGRMPVANVRRDGTGKPDPLGDVASTGRHASRRVNARRGVRAGRGHPAPRP